jgi:hypothetical protein
MITNLIVGEWLPGRSTCETRADVGNLIQAPTSPQKGIIFKGTPSTRGSEVASDRIFAGLGVL